MNYISLFKITLYLFKVENDFDFSLVPILPGIYFWNCRGLSLFLSVDFNFLLDLQLQLFIFNFHVVLGHGILQCQRDKIINVSLEQQYSTTT